MPEAARTRPGAPPLAAAHRYAVYFAHQPNSAWWEAGSAWLGRCAARGVALPQPPTPAVPEFPGSSDLAAARQYSLTAAPRRYGWHATLKAPFQLAPGVALPALQARLRSLCEDLLPFAMPPLRVALVDGDFLALVPQEGAGATAATAAIDAVARACVTGLHGLAAPLPEAELQRRRAAGLTPEEDALLLRWGYPFVLERFRFHLSLTGSLREAGAPATAALRAAAERWFAGLPPTRFASVALFAEASPGADFLLLEHLDLGPA
ncbi:MAG: DUF1045 domain-containing protein [Pseudomonadota bacterium]